MKRTPPDPVERYRELLAHYHRTLDLLSDRALADLDRLLEEAEAYAEAVRRWAPAARTLVDVGSGAGLPGLVIAARRASCRVILTERRRKRASFLVLAAGQMGLPNVEVVQGDVASLAGRQADVVVAQGVGKLVEVYRLTKHVQAAGALLLSRRGPDWRPEVGALEAEVGSGMAVLAAEPMGHHGTLVALRLAGGHACRSSG